MLKEIAFSIDACTLSGAVAAD